MDRAKAMGFDILEICIEDPDTIDVPAIRAKAAQTGIGVTICGAFGPSRNVSSEDAVVRGQGLDYLKRCIDFAEGLGSPSVCGPMYRAVGVTQLLDKPARQAQWDRAAGSSPARRRICQRARDQAGDRAFEPLRDRPHQHRRSGPEARGRHRGAQRRASPRHVSYEHRGKRHPGGDRPRRRAASSNFIPARTTGAPQARIISRGRTSSRR